MYSFEQELLTGSYGGVGEAAAYATSMETSGNAAPDSERGYQGATGTFTTKLFPIIVVVSFFYFL